MSSRERVVRITSNRRLDDDGDDDELCLAPVCASQQAHTHKKRQRQCLLVSGKITSDNGMCRRLARRREIVSRCRPHPTETPNVWGGTGARVHTNWYMLSVAVTAAAAFAAAL